ncbi:MAG TPA: AI-2E family transporter [Polyangiaceae bacterium]|nr:AI-2E family transporter [Polyangiaceae bacterium]
MDPETPEVLAKRHGQRVALGVLLGLTFLVVAWMAAPLLVGLALGTVMGFTAQPLYARLSTQLRQRRALAAALTTLLSGLMIIGAAAAATWLLVREVVNAIPAIERGVGAGSGGLIGPRGARILSALHVDREAVVRRLEGELGRLGDLAAAAARVVAQTSAGVLLTIVVALWTTYYVLLDWPRIARHLERLLPLDPQHTRALVAEFRDVGRRAFVGTVATAVVQGTLAGVGFALFGVPEAAVWGTILALTSFIPVVGTMLVWIPAAMWLLGTGHVTRALLLTGWSLTVVMASNDYVIRPRLVGRDGNANPLLMLVGLIGGIAVFGVAGVIVGPILMSLFVATARIYERERDQELASSPVPPVTSVETATSRLHRSRQRLRSRSLPRGSKTRGSH